MKDPDEIEVEVKIPLACGSDGGDEAVFPPSGEVVEHRLAALGFIPGGSCEQIDTYYNHPAYDLRSQDKALRIRRETNLKTGHMTATINYKGPKIDDRTMSRTEIEFELTFPDEMEKILEGIGYSPVEPVVRKERRDYLRGNVVLSLDRVDGLGDFLEIEVKPAGGSPDVSMRLKQLERVMEELGLRIGDTVRRSYLSMLQERVRGEIVQADL